MKRKTPILLAAILIIAFVLSGCASDVYGNWVTSDGHVYSFGTSQVTIDGESYYFVAKNGKIQIQFTTDLFGGENSFVVDGTYKIQGNNMTLTLGSSTVLDLTRY